ncbi:predicted protein [Postia placenta Mad-698-R]|nr:predicted protein [Postia placenta Mad-698-R]
MRVTLTLALALAMFGLAKREARGLGDSFVQERSGFADNAGAMVEEANSWMLQALQKEEHHSNDLIVSETDNAAELPSLRNVSGPASKHQESAPHQGARTVGAPDRCSPEARAANWPEKDVTLHEAFRREWHTME